MSESTRERAMRALAEAAEVTGAEVWRETEVNRVVPKRGMIQIAEGGYEPEVALSPLMYFHEMPAEVRVTIAAGDEVARDAKLDALLYSLSNAITADRTLGGVVEFTEIGVPTFEVYEGDGAGKAAFLSVTLSFTTIGSPLS